MNSMPSQPDALAEPNPVILPANGNTVAAEDLRVRLVLAADLDGRIEIDASQVDSLGQAVLQILVAAHAEAERMGHPFAIVDPSDAFLARVNACRMAELIGLPAQKDDVQ
jgi:anti-anti-sigma regulatory factor